MGIDRIVRWRPWSGEGLGHLHIQTIGNDIQVAGLAIGQSDGVRFATSYRIVLDGGWRVQSLTLSDTGKPNETATFTHAAGGWESSVAVPDLSNFAACTDVDLSCTPFTNTLPIRRLNLGIGDHADIAVMHFSTPDFRPRVAKQRYTRLAERRYLYEDATFDFTAELEVDKDGLVLDYPGLFRRVPD
jgi:hypothetical protein